MIIKRNGDKVPYDKDKVFIAVEKAFKEVYPNESTNTKKSKKIADYVDAMIQNSEKEDISVEEIQDMVEDILMIKNKPVAKAYIRYRYKRQMARNSYSELMTELNEKISARNVVNQNANVDEKSFGGRMGETADLVAKRIALDYYVSPMAKENHEGNMIYIHDLAAYAVGSHNCYLKSTKFITQDGIMSFEDYKDGDEVKVLTMNGTWSDAIVHMYGRQPMYEITLKRAGIEKTVVCTRNHRWVLKDGTVTDNLQIGDSLYALQDTTDYNIETKRDAEMFCFGFIIGDGCDHNGFIEVRLCGEKSKYLNTFLNAGYRLSYVNDEPYLRKKVKIGKQEFLNSKMWNVLSFKDKQMLFNGYYSADGGHTTNTKHIWTSDERVRDMIEDISALSGYHIINSSVSNSDTNYKENRTLYNLTFSTHHPSNALWKVVNIQKGSHRNADYEAWCVEEPTTHTFTLEGGIVTGNCLSIPFDDLLAKGFNTRQTDVRPAQSINTAFQLLAVIFQLQSLNQFGGVSATHLDWTMIPYVRKSFYKHIKNGLKYMGDPEDYKVFNIYFKQILDECSVSIENSNWSEYFTDEFIISDSIYKYAMDMTVKETYQAVEGMYHNLNTLQSRSGNQLPFTSINYGTCTEPEGRLVTKALLDVSIKGIGKLHKTSIFPCGIFQSMRGVNQRPGDPNYDLFQLALKSTSLRLYPNYANVDWSGNEGYDKNDPRTFFSTMGCRTANGWDINGFGQLKDGRGNICPVTIIMPTLAMMAEKVVSVRDYHDARDTFTEFYYLLDKKIHEAKDMLIERFEWICSQSSDSAKFMYENGVMYGYVPEEGIRSALKHGTLAIGQLGLAETLQIIFGVDHTTEIGMKYAKEIESLFKKRCAEFKEQYKLNFGVYFSPAENLCYTAMQKFKKKYGEISNVSDKEFFTNSIHVPVWKEMNAFDKINLESQLTGYSSAGCITYVELKSSVKNNLEGLESLVLYAMDKDVPYLAINIPNDMCQDCGYTDEINNECPMCKCEDIRRLRRVTGYLTGDYKTAFNKGKQQEVEMRVKHG